MLPFIKRRISRRSFVGCAAAAVAVLSVPAEESAAARYKIIGFIKPFQNFEFARIAEVARELGWDGVEIPVRKGGTIEPEQVEEKLPDLAEKLKKAGVKLSIIATDVADANDPLARKVLNTARRLGIGLYRAKHLRYDLKEPIAPQVDRLGHTLHDLAQLNKELGIQGGVQNHSGADYLGAPVWDLWHMLRDIDPNFLGIYFDIAHATIEGGLSWPLESKLVEPHLVALSVKDFTWVEQENAKNKWREQWCPLGEGMVHPEFFQNLKQTRYSGAISMHFEYDLGQGDSMIGGLRKDTQTLRRWVS
jgi:sugar phosphate isomerase/epimerase